MIKRYKSKSAISVNVVLRKGKSMHVSFTVQSDGSSVYLTENEEVQYGLEHHYKYGKLFYLVRDAGEVKDEKQEAEADKPESKMRKVKVSDLAAAKDFLADTFGVSRTSLRSGKSIVEAAKEHHIEFVGLS